MGAATVAIAAVLALVLLSAGSASARTATSAAFSIPASNGFVLDVADEAGRLTIIAAEKRPPLATFTPGGAPRPAGNGNGAASIYQARSVGADPTAIDAELGRLGRIAVSFRPSGRSRVTRLPPDGPLGCGRAVRIVRGLGTFVGTISFRGEDGYTSVTAVAAPGSLGTPLPRACAAGSPGPRGAALSAGGSAGRAGAVLSAGGPTGSSGNTLRAAGPAGAMLRATNRRAGVDFEARRTGAGVAFRATWRQRLGGGVTVTRLAFAGAPRAALRLGRGARSARLSPPAPFAGVAHYHRGEKGRPTWTGTLNATFPGAMVPIVGPTFSARLAQHTL